MCVVRCRVAALPASALIAVAAGLLAISPSSAASSIPNGAYRTTLTHNDLHVPGVSAEDEATNVGRWTLTLSNGSWTLVDKPPAGYPPGDHIAGTYSSSGRIVTFLHKTPKVYAGVAPKVTWSFDGKALQLKPVSGFPAKVVSLVWTKHAWTKVG
jgi:hypothetical protein